MRKAGVPSGAQSAAKRHHHDVLLPEPGKEFIEVEQAFSGAKAVAEKAGLEEDEKVRLARGIVENEEVDLDVGRVEGVEEEGVEDVIGRMEGF